VRFDRPEGCDWNTGLQQGVLFVQSVLCGAQYRCRRVNGLEFGRSRDRVGVDVLEFVRNNVDYPCEVPRGAPARIVIDYLPVSHLPCRTPGIGVQHDGLVVHLPGRNCEHPPELTTPDDANRGARVKK